MTVANKIQEMTIDELQRVIKDCRKRLTVLNKPDLQCSGTKLCARCGPERGMQSVLAFTGKETVCRQCRAGDRKRDRQRAKFYSRRPMSVSFVD